MTKQVRLPQGLFATVDDCDYELVSKYTWKLARDKSNIYAIASVKVNGRMTTIRMHRVILGAKPGTTIDHINGNGLDNRRANLRFCSHNENNRNRQKRGKFTSRYKGVYQLRGSIRWKASIKCEGVQTHLGTFDREVDAAKAYDAAAREKFGEFARTNF
jgi:hypothetical protein